MGHPVSAMMVIIVIIFKAHTHDANGKLHASKNKPVKKEDQKQAQQPVTGPEDKALKIGHVEINQDGGKHGRQCKADRDLLDIDLDKLRHIAPLMRRYPFMIRLRRIKTRRTPCSRPNVADHRARQA